MKLSVAIIVVAFAVCASAFPQRLRQNRPHRPNRPFGGPQQGEI